MATHSSILAWRILLPVQSMGSQRVRHDWGDFHTHLQKQGIFSEPREVPLRESYSKFAEYEHQVVAIPAQSDLLSLLSSLLSTLLLH